MKKLLHPDIQFQADGWMAVLTIGLVLFGMIDGMLHIATALR